MLHTTATACTIGVPRVKRKHLKLTVDLFSFQYFLPVLLSIRYLGSPLSSYLAPSNSGVQVFQGLKSFNVMLILKSLFYVNVMVQDEIQVNCIKILFK